MNAIRFLGIVMLVAGAVVLAIAYQAGGFQDLGAAFQASHWDRSTWLVLIGALMGLLGVVGICVPQTHRLVLKRVVHRNQRWFRRPGPAL